MNDSRVSKKDQKARVLTRFYLDLGSSRIRASSSCGLRNGWNKRYSKVHVKVKKGKVPQGLWEPKQRQRRGQEVSKTQTHLIRKIYTENITIYHLVLPLSIRKPLSETELWTRCTSGLIQYGHSFIPVKKLEEPCFISPVERKYPQGTVSRNSSWSCAPQASSKTT